MTRLVQVRDGSTRRVALVEEPYLRLLHEVTSIAQLAQDAIDSKSPLTALIRQKSADERLDYDSVYDGRSRWCLLPPIDHPEEPTRCLVSGTGLTHLGSAKNRQTMHEVKESDLTDSMENVSFGGWRAGSRHLAQWAFRLNGFTKGRERSSARTANRWSCPNTAKMVVRKRRSPGSISSTATDNRTALA